MRLQHKTMTVTYNSSVVVDGRRWERRSASSISPDPSMANEDKAKVFRVISLTTI